MQKELDRENAEFWNELCGTCFAKALGIKDHSLQSLNQFDQAYFSFYPYLLKHVPLQDMKSKNVLEVGLGYGSLGLKIAQAGANYTGLDISPGPVKMLSHRLKLFDLPGTAIVSSVLDCPLESSSQDYVISIGCYHHTGNLQKALHETYRVLKPNGTAIIMLYSQFSYRQWRKWPLKTFRSLLHECKILKNRERVDQEQKKAYDATAKGLAAPETVFTSVKQLKNLFSQFSTLKYSKENWDEPAWPTRLLLSRKVLMATIGKLAGLDLYVTAKK